MILGGSRYVLPLIKKAHDLNVFVITCDYLPKNVAHKYSDLYLNISILDKEKVLEAARRFNIDGITSFGCDPGVITAAYVAEKLGLPSVGPYESVCILQNKDLFRDFLRKNGFNTPWSRTFSSPEIAAKVSNSFAYPVIVKPTDSAGSKGVTKVVDCEGMADAIRNAFDNSIGGKIIVEEFIEKEGCSSDSDCYSVNGKLDFVSFSNQYFDERCKNPFTPSAFMWPSSMSDIVRSELKNELQRLIALLNMKTSIYNVETRISKSGKPYIMEVSPRGGGNRIAEIITLHTGIDLIARHIKDCLGIPCDDTFTYNKEKRIAEIIVHSLESGRYSGIQIDNSIKHKIMQLDIWVKRGEFIDSFTGANKAIGTVIMSLDDNDEVETLQQKITVKIK